MTAPSPPAERPGPPADRYGPPADPRRRRRAIAALAVLAAAGVALVVWLALGMSDAPVRWSQVGFAISGTESGDVTYDVTRTDPDVPVECRVEAQNAAHAQVGVVVVEVAAGDQATVRLTTTVRTSEAAVTGFVNECWVRP